MVTLVTGATGFVGSAVVRRLLSAGHRVRVLVRPSSYTRNIEGLPVEVHKGDLTDPDSIREAMSGCDSLFHVAADYRLWVPDPQTMRRINVTGTVNVMREALRAGVKRIVYTSSVATLGCSEDGCPVDESFPSTLNDMIGQYKKTKFLAEEEVRRLVTEEGLPAVIVSPSTPVGPRDVKPTPTGRMIINALSGRMPAYVDTGLNIVGVEDVAEGHLLALEKGVIGERYILGGENMTLRGILEELSSITGTTPPRIRLPHGVVLPIAYLSETWAGIFSRREPQITVDGVRMAKKFMFYSSEKALRELGYRPGPVRDALIEAVRWFIDNGYCLPRYKGRRIRYLEERH